MSFFNRNFFVGVGAGVALAFILIFGAGAVLFFQMKNLVGPEAGFPPPPFPKQETVAGLEWQLQHLDGSETSLSDFQGKVLFINRWATWCAPCIAEMPSIQRLHQRFPQEEMAFLLISDEPAQTVREFVQEKGWDLPIFLSESPVPAAFESPGIPATFIVDQTGRIVFQHVGGARWDDDSSTRFLNNLLRVHD